MHATTRVVVCCATGLIALAPALPAAMAAAPSSSPTAHAASCSNGQEFLSEPDYNGDGYTDYVVGMPNANDGRGGIEVVLGGQHQPIVLLPGTHGIPSVPAASHFGASSAAISVTSAGCDDLLVGIPDLTVDGMPEAGGIQVLIGTPSGFTAGPTITAGTGGAPGEPEPDAHFGTSVSSYFSEVTVGVPGATVMGGPDDLTPLKQAGEVVTFEITASGNVVPTGQTIETMAVGAQAGAHYGTVVDGTTHLYDNMATAPDASDGSKLATGYFEIRGNGFFGQAAGDRLGASLSGGPPRSDDGDIASAYVGAPGHRVAGHEQAGAVEVFAWEVEGLTYQKYVGTITQATKGVPGAPATGALFGAAITATDPSPGRVDLVIAAPGQKVASTAGAGAIYMERFADQAGHGSTPAGWNALDWSTITQATHGVPGMPRKGGAFGDALASIASGSEPDAGAHTLIVGIPYTHPAGQPASGAVEAFLVGPKGVIATKATLFRRADGSATDDGFGTWIQGQE